VRVAGCAIIIACLASPATAQAPHKPASKPAAPASGDFAALEKKATEARQAERWEQAIGLYQKLVKLNPDYVEGYWYQGTAYYSLDDFPNCRNAFQQLIRRAPKNGAAHAFLGLCEFAVKEYDRALQHLVESRNLGIGDVPDLGKVARYHAAVLMSRSEQYEQALETLGEFASEGEDNPRIIEAMGIATLRLPMLPIELPPDRREMVLMAGRASYMMAMRNKVGAETAFKALVARYPETPNVHYGFGVFLLQEQADQAIEEFKRELTLQPGHPWSLMQLAYEHLKRGEPKEALPFAKQAVDAAPKAFPARKALGQALLETGDVDGAIRELQTGIQLAPQSPGLHFTLARALQRAGRLEEAEKERNEFVRLDRLVRTIRSGEQSVGGHIERLPGPAKKQGGS
jgi:tetratricopeptide (TPR) repeat protein